MAKVGPAGRYGVKYGRTLRTKLNKIEEKQRSRQVCPQCKQKAVKRVSSGIWQCRKCNAKFAGKAYEV